MTDTADRRLATIVLAILVAPLVWLLRHAWEWALS